MPDIHAFRNGVHLGRSIEDCDRLIECLYAI